MTGGLNFWDTEIWSFIITLSVLFGGMLLAVLLSRKIRFLKNSLLPSSVLGGLVVIIAGLIYKGITGEPLLSQTILESLTYHGLGLEVLFSDRLVQQTIDDNGQLTEEKEVTLSAYKKMIKIDETGISREGVQAVSIVQKNTLILHIKGQKEHFEYKGSKRFNAVKYMDLFSTYKG